MDSKNKWSFGVFAAIRNLTWEKVDYQSFWLVKHSYGEKKWSLPGGGLELGEKIDQGVKRETKEETGFEIEIVNPPIGIFSLRKSLGIAVLFSGHIVGGTNNPNPNEISECRAFNFEDMVIMAERGEIYPAQFGLVRQAMRAVLTKQSQWPIYDWLIKPT